MNEKYHERKLEEQRRAELKALREENDELKMVVAEQADALIELAEIITEV
jgi:hypothetical protein